MYLVFTRMPGEFSYVTQVFVCCVCVKSNANQLFCLLILAVYYSKLL